MVVQGWGWGRRENTQLGLTQPCSSLLPGRDFALQSNQASERAVRTGPICLFLAPVQGELEALWHWLQRRGTSPTRPASIAPLGTRCLPVPACERPLVSPSLVAVPKPGTSPRGMEPEVIYSSTANA